MFGSAFVKCYCSQIAFDSQWGNSKSPITLTARDPTPFFFGPLQTHSASTDIGTQKHTHMKTHT